VGNNKGLKIAVGALAVVAALAILGTVYGAVAVLRATNSGAGVYYEHAQQNQDAENEAEIMAATLQYAQSMPHVVIGNDVYYISQNSGFYLYRLRTAPFSHKLYLPTPVFGVITDGEMLLLLAQEADVGKIVIYDPAAGEGQVLATHADIHGEFRKAEGVIFYADMDGEARAVSTCGREIRL
jgi:hypothetical protein